MEQNLEKQLKQIYRAPKPEHKQEFISQKFSRQMRPRKISMGYMLRIQLAYITRKAWFLSGLIFAGIVLISQYVQPEMVGAIFALTPFLGLLTVVESMRSITAGMSELEMACRFSLKSVVMAKMGLLGVENLVLLGVAAGISKVAFFPCMIYLLVPYFITALGNLFLVRKIPGREVVYGCAALAAVVSFGQLLLVSTWRWLYEPQWIGIWVVMGILCFGMVGRELYQTMNKTEELAWN